MSTTSAENLYLSVDQVAQRFNVSKDSIWRWKRNGEFPKPFKLGGCQSASNRDPQSACKRDPLGIWVAGPMRRSFQVA